MMPEIPKGYRVLQMGEKKEVGDKYWTWLDGHADLDFEGIPELGWVEITEPEPIGEEYIDEGHVTTIRKI